VRTFRNPAIATSGLHEGDLLDADQRGTSDWRARNARLIAAVPESAFLDVVQIVAGLIGVAVHGGAGAHGNGERELRYLGH
jgi:hypothetical protein